MDERQSKKVRLNPPQEHGGKQQRKSFAILDSLKYNPNQTKITQNITSNRKDDSIEQTAPGGTVRNGREAPTKLQTVVTQMKAENPRSFLLFENGFRYFMFGDDARFVGETFGKTVVPSKNANFSNKDDPYAYTSIRQENLAVLVKQLTSSGLQVGLVEQSETELDAKGSTGKRSNRLLERKLTRLYTKATFLNDISDNEPTGKNLAEEAESKYLLAVTEVDGAPGKYSIATTSVLVSSGEAITDQFEDTPSLLELDSRISLISPCEILIIGSISDPIAQLIARYGRLASSPVRIEKREKYEPHVSQDYLIRRFEKNPLQLDKILNLDSSLLICIHSISEYLEKFGLDIGSDIKQNTHQHTMKLTSTTLTNLEVFHNIEDYASKGSLFWLLDHTSTVFGQRLLREWVSRPLVDQAMIESRLDVIQELMNRPQEEREMVKRSIENICDLETVLTKINYGKIKHPQLYQFLKQLKGISRLHLTKFKNTKLAQIFGTIPSISGIIDKLLSCIRTEFSADLTGFFRSDYEDYEDIENQKDLVGMADQDLKHYLNVLKEESGLSGISYKTGKSKALLVEVLKNDISKVPKHWIKTEASKIRNLYSTENLDTLRYELDKAKNGVKLASEEVYKGFVGKVAKNYEEIRSAVVAIAEIDCFLSMAIFSDGLARPKFRGDLQLLDIREAWNPVVMSQTSKLKYVKTDVSMNMVKDRVAIISGPNMGGKSTYVRQVAIVVLLAQIGCFVPAKTATLGIFDGIHTRMGASDKIMQGKSTFMVEMSECAAIISKSTEKSLVILDEIGRGTGTVDGSRIAAAILRYFITDIKCILLFITHYPAVMVMDRGYLNIVSNWHADYERKPGKKNIEFRYRIVRGAATASFGLNVASMANIPESVIELAETKSEEMKEADIINRKALENINIIRLIKTGKIDDSIFQDVLFYLDSKKRRIRKRNDI